MNNIIVPRIINSLETEKMENISNTSSRRRKMDSSI